MSVSDESGRTTGMVRQLSRGGMMFEPWRSDIEAGKQYRLTLIDPAEHTRFTILCRIQHATAKRVGCLFEDVDPDAAVQLGTLIGKYYSGSDSPG